MIKLPSLAFALIKYQEIQCTETTSNISQIWHITSQQNWVNIVAKQNVTEGDIYGYLLACHLLKIDEILLESPIPESLFCPTLVAVSRYKKGLISKCLGISLWVPTEKLSKHIECFNFFSICEIDCLGPWVSMIAHKCIESVTWTCFTEGEFA